MNSKPLVSAVIIFLKAGRFIEEAIESVFAQTYDNWELVPDVEARTLIPLIKQRVKRGSTICSDTWKSYTGIVAKGYVHRLVEHGKGEYSDNKGNHINGLEGFWGYLKRRLAAKGGIRKERLSLYLAEYVWRYNHRTMSVHEKTGKMLSLLRSMLLSKNLVA